MKKNIVTLVEKKETKVTQEDIEKKTIELCEMINKFEGSKADVAEHVCFHVVNWAAYNRYEAVGIFTEAMLAYREAEIESSEKEED